MSNQKTNQKILGIDLGTTNSAAAIYEGGHATVIPSAEGPTMAGKMFPSVVAFTKDGQLLVGEPAKRQATTNPGEIAGFQVMRIINEPTAACLAYGIDKLEHEMKILVFSFGGGTHDVTLMDFGKGVFQVLSTSGDTQLGGTDVDKAVTSYILDEFKRQTGVANST